MAMAAQHMEGQEGRERCTRLFWSIRTLGPHEMDELIDTWGRE